MENETMTLLYMDDRFLQHETGQHPECPARLQSIHAAINKSGLLEKVAGKCPYAHGFRDDDILRVDLSRIWRSFESLLPLAEGASKLTR